MDDGSTDNTAEIVTKATQQHPWIRLHQRSDRGKRMVGAGPVEAFNDGLSFYDLDDYDFVCKLDGDLEFGSDYFERLVQKFNEDTKLGTASGKCWDKHGSRWVMLRTNDEFSMGACKFYRTACFQDIGGFVRGIMWDGIDCHRCRMMGWKARSFHDEDLRLFELRPMGSSDKTVLHGRLRWGRGQYFMGTHPLYALGIGTYRMFERPFVVGGACILLGYLSALIRRIHRYDDLEFRKYLRTWQLAKLGIRH